MATLADLCHCPVTQVVERGAETLFSLQRAASTQTRGADLAPCAERLLPPTAASRYSKEGHLPRTEPQMSEEVLAVKINVISQVEGDFVILNLEEITSKAAEMTGAYLFVIKPTWRVRPILRPATTHRHQEVFRPACTPEC